MEPSTAAYSLASAGFWRCYWITLRPYLCFLSGAAGVTGLVLHAQVSWLRAAVTFAALFGTYGLGQALTDVFQTDTDAISAPYRPLVRGEISRGQVLGISLAGLGLCTVVVMVCNPYNVIPCALGVAGLASYTTFKRRWWAGPAWNAWVMALLPVIGFLCGGIDPASVTPLWLPAAAAASTFFCYIPFVLLGYFKDISADRATGYDTLVVRFGWRAGVVVSGVCAAAAVLVSWHLVVGAGLARDEGLGLHVMICLLLWFTGVIFMGGAHLGMLLTRREDEAHAPIAHSVRGFVLLRLVEIVAFKPELLLVGLGYYLAFELSLAWRPARSQI